MKTDILVIFNASSESTEHFYDKWSQKSLDAILKYGAISSIMENASEAIVRPLFLERGIGAHTERFYHREFRSRDGGPFREYRSKSAAWEKAPDSQYFGEARDIAKDLKAITIAGYNLIPITILKTILNSKTHR